jgi:hypothetical protein
MNLSEHFTLKEAIESETADRYGIDNTPSQTVIQNMKKASEGMEKVRSLLGDKACNVSSWYRSKMLNRKIGSNDTSDHPEGWCIDFRCPKFGTPQEICNKIVEDGTIKFDQLIYEGSWVHISFSPKMRGEVKTAVFRSGKRPVYLAGIR